MERVGTLKVLGLIQKHEMKGILSTLHHGVHPALSNARQDAASGHFTVNG